VVYGEFSPRKVRSEMAGIGDRACTIVVDPQDKTGSEAHLEYMPHFMLKVQGVDHITALTYVLTLGSKELN